MAVLISSVIIVLREVLEAALLLSILLATSQRIRLRKRWLGLSLIIGLAGALIYANSLAAVSELFEGMGQEIVNTGMQLGVCASLIVTVFLFAQRHERLEAHGFLLPVSMAIAVALATAREGSEIYLYVSGFLRVQDIAMSVGIGSITGAGIGFSIGVLFYYLLLALPRQRCYWIAIGLLGLAAANMCSQAILLLIQADWLQVEAPLWDTSSLISESSVPGQLLYALVGYEATPSAFEAGGYLLSLLAVGIAAFIGWRLLPLPSEDRV